MMGRALIGHTGFVGTNLLAHGKYGALFNTANSRQMCGQHFKEVVCAGTSAIKWKANKDPVADWAGVSNLIENLEGVRADYFVLISTVDVYQNPINVTEMDFASEEGAAYGANRAKLERFIRERFKHHLIVRLPALYGVGLRKNAIYDLQNDNMVEKIDPLGSFQWYDVRRLEADLAAIRDQDLKLLNISAEPIEMREIGDRFFPGKLRAPDPTNAPVRYDMRTLHPTVLGGRGAYHFSRSQVLEGISSYLEAGR
ncbi:Rossmann-fold NAD(P)-binding domain-containing protein [Methylobacterium goesingense]|uniref:Nucleoside-diphosphate-sugar epimerase n=1 Tax=Methylobacterium goesingense TaxID=243690 RepID=A0ABV2LDH3_9HYPH|nr:NAD(P)-dependent oxidoreductase [Methylobacterium goesingense]GJD76312.1 hypothetical protein CFIICLFH_4568 [Methylobacterium goesingense]